MHTISSAKRAWSAHHISTSTYVEAATGGICCLLQQLVFTDRAVPVYSMLEELTKDNTLWVQGMHTRQLLEVKHTIGEPFFLCNS